MSNAQEQVPVLNVSSVPVAEKLIPAKHSQITVTRRASKDKETGKKVEILAGERSRSVLIPELTITDVPSKYVQFLLEMLYSVAQAQLTQLWETAGWGGLREVPASIWTVDSLLMFAAREAESKRLSEASIKEWFAASELKKLLATKSEAMQKSYEKGVLGLAAPALDYAQEQCEKLIAALSKSEDDRESIIGSQLIAKLQRRVEKIQQQLKDVNELEAL